MILFPAIDLKDGNCVRLYKGEMDQATVFNDDPGDQARQFEKAGCEWLHIVDLNGAFAGRPVNGEAVDAILESVTVPVQLGGGLRTLEGVDAALGWGLDRVILGTAALRDPELVKHAAGKYPGRVVVGIDAREGRVAVEGWLESSETTAVDLARRFEDAGVAAIVYTDIARDGMLTGPNIDATVSLAESIGIPVMVSCGVAANGDVVQAAKFRDEGICGVIVGRAIYTGGVDLDRALQLIEAL